MEITSEYESYWNSDGSWKFQDFKCLQCGLEFKHASFFDKNVCPNCNPKDTRSSLEESILDFIKQHYDGHILVNECLTLGGRNELDLYLSDLRLGIEINGSYWHGVWRKGIEYHKDKSYLASLKGVKLLHIWEHDWSFKEDIVKSILLSKLGKTPNRIYARQCVIQEVSYNKAMAFFNENHLQGGKNSGLYLGLFHNNQLVACLSISHYKKDNYLEIDRYANLLNTTVVGGFSRLLSYVDNLFPNIDIFSYASVDLNNIKEQSIYYKLGFKYEGWSSPTILFIDKQGTVHHWREFAFNNSVNKENTKSMFKIADAGNFKFKKKASNKE